MIGNSNMLTYLNNCVIRYMRVMHVLNFAETYNIVSQQGEICFVVRLFAFFEMLEIKLKQDVILDDNVKCNARKINILCMA